MIACVLVQYNEDYTKCLEYDIKTIPDLYESLEEIKTDISKEHFVYEFREDGKVKRRLKFK